MFSINQKREIADKVQAILKETRHPELPEGEISFSLHIDGAEAWSWADIKNNKACGNPSTNPWNERQQLKSETITLQDGGKLLILPDTDQVWFGCCKCGLVHKIKVEHVEEGVTLALSKEAQRLKTNR